MYKVHLTKRTYIPDYGTRQEPNGEVKTYYLTEEQLAYYRNLAKPSNADGFPLSRYYVFKTQ